MLTCVIFGETIAQQKYVAEIAGETLISKKFENLVGCHYVSIKLKIKIKLGVLKTEE